jgi:hypothetical protein
LPDDLVFTTPGGDVMRNHNFRSRVFVPARGPGVVAPASEWSGEDGAPAPARGRARAGEPAL